MRAGEATVKAANPEIRDVILEDLRSAQAKLAPGVVDPEERNNDLDPEVRFEKHALDRFKSTKDSVNSELSTHGSVMTYAPILPLCKPYLLVERLTAAGIANSKFEGYTVLDQQLVVGITNEELTKKLAAYTNLQEGFDSITKLGQAAYKLRANLDKYTDAVQNLRSTTLGVLAQMVKVPELANLDTMLRGAKINTLKPKTYDVVISVVHKICTVLKEMLDYIPERVTADTIYDGMIRTAEKTTGKKLIAVGKPSLALGASWLWLVTAKELNTISKCALGGHCSIAKWGLAFSS